MVIVIIVVLFIGGDTAPPLRFLDTPAPEAIAETPYFFCLPVIGGSNLHREFLLKEGVLPDGLGLDIATGLIYGVPHLSPGRRSESLAYPLLVSVRDSLSQDTHRYELTVRPTAIPFDPDKSPMLLGSPGSDLPAARVGTPFSARLSVTGGVEPYIWWRSGEWPTGALDLIEGVVVGTPTKPGRFDLRIGVGYQRGSFEFAGRTFSWAGDETSASYSLPVYGPLGHQIMLPIARVGDTWVGGVLLQNAFMDEKVSWACNVPGVASDGGAGLQGIPTDVGTYTISYEVRRGTEVTGRGSGKLLVLPRSPEPRINSSAFVGRVDEDVDFAVAYQGLIEPVDLQVRDELPLGLRREGTHLRGRLREVGRRKISVGMKDALGVEIGGQIEMTTRQVCGPLAPDVPDSLVVVAGKSFRIPLGARGGEGGYTWSLSGATSDMALDGNQLSGVVTSPSVVILSLVVADSISGESAEARIQIRALPADQSAPMILTNFLAPAVVGEPYQAVLAGAGGVGLYSWAIRGNLAEGLDVVGPLISGTAREVGRSEIEVSMTDALGQQAGPVSLALEVIDPAAGVRKELTETAEACESVTRLRDMERARAESLAARVDSLSVLLQRVEEDSNPPTRALPARLVVTLLLIALVPLVILVLKWAKFRRKG